jgi:Cu+-exporting ATPase
MTCAACQANVQRALERTTGVRRAAVNLMTHDATVVYDPRLASPQRLVEAVNDVGYESRLPKASDTGVAADEAREQAERHEYEALLSRALVSVGIGAIAMVVSMPLMGGGDAHAAHAAGDPLRRWIMTSLDPWVRGILPWLYALDVNLLRWALLAATLFVMVWAGGHIYTRAWAAFRHRNADMNTLIAIGTGAAFLYSAVATLAPTWLARESGAPDVYCSATPWKHEPGHARRRRWGSWRACSRQRHECGAARPRRTSGWKTCGRGIASWSDRASASRSTAWSSAAPAPQTNRC